MKTSKKIKFYSSIALFLLTSIFLISCEGDNAQINDEALNQELENVSTQAKIDDLSEGIDDLVENVSLDFTDDFMNKNTISKNNDFFSPECVTITKEIDTNIKKITLDFGDGCSTKNENSIRGKIIIEVLFNFGEKSINLNYTFDNFYFNDKKVEGEVHKYKIRINENGNPEVTINRNLTITWEDGSFVNVKGDRKREWTEGIGNGNWEDNVFLITGSWTFTKKDGSVITATIVDALQKNMACRFMVSGIVEIQKNDNTIILNYGDGNCDNLATATINGVEHEFNLKKRRKD